MQWLLEILRPYQLQLCSPSSKNQERGQQRPFMDTSLSHEHYKENKVGGWKVLVAHFAFRRDTQLTLLHSPKGSTWYVPVCQHCLVGSDPGATQGTGTGWVKSTWGTMPRGCVTQLAPASSAPVGG